MLGELTDVKVLAELLSCSRQTVYNHIQKNKKKLTGHIKKIDRTTFFDNEGIEIIKMSMGLIEPPEVVVIEEDAMDKQELLADIVNSVREANKDDMDMVRLELDEVKKQNQLLLDKMDELIKEQKNKQSLWQRLLGK